MSVNISILTVSFNCIETIEDCLDSVLTQTYPHREHVVIDGASQDGTLALLQARIAQLAVLVSEPDLGIYDALNKGIARASGDVVGFMHADDVYASPDVLENVAQAFADPTVCAVYGDLEYVSTYDTNKVVRRWQSKAFSTQRLAWGWMPPHPTLYVRREWYRLIGGFDIRYKISADYFSILQLFNNPEFKSVYIPKVFVKMRLGGISNRSLYSIIRKSYEDWDSLQRTGAGAWCGLRALIWKNLSKVRQFF